MNNSEKEKAPESDDNLSFDEDTRKPMLWGPFYFILGLIGLGFSIFSGFYDFENIVPLFGTVIAGILIGAISLLILAYGYRIMKRDI